MRFRTCLIALSFFLLGAASPQLPPLSEEAIARYANSGDSSRFTRNALLAGWERNLKAALKRGGIDSAAGALAPANGLTAPQMRAFVRLWLIAETRSRGSEREKAERAEIRRRLLALLPAARHAPIVLAATADILDRFADCSAADFEAMMLGSTRPADDAWLIATNAPCQANFARFVEATPEQAAPGLIQILRWGRMQPIDALPLHAWLSSPDGEAHVAVSDRQAFRIWVLRQYLRLLFETGVADKAIALLEKLPEGVRSEVMTPGRPEFEASVDGRVIAFDQDNSSDDLRLDFAAAYALAGRTAEARAQLSAIRNLAQAREFLTCKQTRSFWQCRRDFRLNADMLVLDHLLEHAGDDPYPLAESLFAKSADSTTVPLAGIRCRVFDEPKYAEICSAGAMERRPYLVYGFPAENLEASRRIRVLLDRLRFPGLPQARADFDTIFQQAATSYRGKAKAVAASSFPPRTPAVVPYTELALPQAYRGNRPDAPAWPKEWTRLPDGVLPIRTERHGDRIVVIARTLEYGGYRDTYGPPGYWLHLSGDAGKSWRAYYTGLRPHQPYVVFAASRLPLIHGDMLDIEVEIAEPQRVDSAHPTRILRPERRVPHRYLRMSLADLTRDSNGDGMSDIAESHLMLDGRANTETPFIVGSSPASRCAGTTDQLVHKAMLEAAYEFGERVAGPGRFSGIYKLEQPILFSGDPDDFACVHPDRLMIVYGADEMASLRNAEARLVVGGFSKPVFNRQRDRGYYRFGGGAYRVRLAGGKWTVEMIDSPPII